MYRATTPTFTLTFDEDTVDFTEASSICVTFADKSKNVLLEKEDADLTVTSNTIGVYLTQAETLALPTGKIQIQVNWTYDSDGTTMRACSKKVTLDVYRNLKEEEM